MDITISLAELNTMVEKAVVEALKTREMLSQNEALLDRYAAVLSYATLPVPQDVVLACRCIQDVVAWHSGFGLTCCVAMQDGSEWRFMLDEYYHASGWSYTGIPLTCPYDISGVKWQVRWAVLEQLAMEQDCEVDDLFPHYGRSDRTGLVGVRPHHIETHDDYKQRAGQAVGMGKL